jgi:hypothetical protein
VLGGYTKRFRNFENETPVIVLSIYLSMALRPFVGPWPLFQFRKLIRSR